MPSVDFRNQVGDLCFESIVLLGAVTAGFLPAPMLVAYLMREFWVGGIRRFMAGARVDVPSSAWGKVKTNLLMWGSLPCYLSLEGAAPALEPYLGGVGRAMVGLGLLASYASAVGYTRAFIAGYDRTASDENHPQMGNSRAMPACVSRPIQRFS